MRQLTQRVILIHELWQLGRTKELFDSRCYRFNIDQRLRGNSIRILCCHSFTNHSFQTGHTDSVLILQQFSNCTNTTIAKVVNIIISSQSIFQVDIIVNGSKNIFHSNVFRNQFMNMTTNCFFQFIFIIIFFHQPFQFRIVNHLCNTQFFRVTIHIMCQINHHIGKNFYISFFCLNPYKRNCRILNRICQFFCHFSSCFCQNLTWRSIYHVFCQNLSCDTVSQKQFFIEFVTSYFCQVITFRIKEHTVYQALCTLHCQRLTWTDLFI